MLEFNIVKIIEKFTLTGLVFFTILFTLSCNLLNNSSDDNPGTTDPGTTDPQLLEQNGFIVSLSHIEVPESGSTHFAVTLNAEPTAEVKISLRSSDSSEGTISPDKLSLTAENWSVPQQITVTGVDDHIADGNQSFRVILHEVVSVDKLFDNQDPPAVEVTSVDENVGGQFYLGSLSGPTSEWGQNATFTVHLTSKPTGEVTLPLHSSDTTEGILSTDKLVFTPGNWYEVQTVTITGVTDREFETTRDNWESDKGQEYSIVFDASSSNDLQYHGINLAGFGLLNFGTKRINGSSTGRDVVHGITIDSSNNLYMVGYSNYSYVDDGEQFPRRDMTFFSFTGTLEERWDRIIEGVGPPQFTTDEGYDVTLDQAGNIYVTGKIEDVAVGDINFLKKHTSNAVQEWQVDLDTPGRRIVINEEAIYVMEGWSYTTEPRINTGEGDISLTKYSLNKEKLWTNVMGSTQTDIALDSTGAIYLTGFTYGGLDGENSGEKDFFLSKYAPDGNIVWVKQLGTIVDDIGNAIAIDAQDNIYVTGMTAEGLGATNTNHTDMLLVKFDLSGNQLWTRQYGFFNDQDIGNAVAIDPNGYVYVTGNSYFITEFKRSTVAVFKYDFTGGFQWALHDVKNPSNS